MKIIGTTEAGARLVKITTEEIIALNAAAQTLNSMSCVTINAPVPLAPPPDHPYPIKNKKTKRTDGQVRSVNSLLRQGFGGQAGQASEVPTGKKGVCLYCEKPLPKNAHPSMKTHNGKCKKMYAREYARNHYYTKHGRKSPPRESILNVGPALDPSDPTLSDAERKTATEFKARRLALIAAAVERTAN